MIKKGTVCCIVLIIVLLMGNTALAATGMPAYTIVFGNKAFSLSYIMDTANQEEMNQAFEDAMYSFQFKDLDNTWIDARGKSIPSSVIPEVIYKNGSETKKYAAGDGEEIPLNNDYTVIKADFKATPIGLSVTVSVENHEGASKFVVYKEDKQVSQVVKIGTDAPISPIHIKINDEITVKILDEDEKVLFQGNLSVVNGETSVIVETEENPNNNLDFKVTDIY